MRKRRVQSAVILSLSPERIATSSAVATSQNPMCGTEDNALSALEWRLMNTSLIGQEAAPTTSSETAASPDGEPQLKELASLTANETRTRTHCPPPSELRPLEHAVELVECGRFLVCPHSRLHRV